MTYLVIKVGAEQDKRWLATTKLGDVWTDTYGASRFTDEAEARKASDERENTSVIYHDPKTNNWGELI